MALTVEDGTGLSNADSYVSLVDYRAYAVAHGDETVADRSDDEAEADLRKGFLYVNSYAIWKSSPVSNAQSGEFPRTDLSDGMGRTTSAVPKRVKDAQCEAAMQAGQGVDLFVVADRGGQVQSESVGPISTTYFAGAQAGTLFEAVNKLLAPFIRDPMQPRKPLPSFNDYEAEGRADPIFGVGMDDNPGTGTDVTE